MHTYIHAYDLRPSSESEPFRFSPHLRGREPYRDMGSGDLFGLDRTGRQETSERDKQSNEVPSEAVTTPYPNWFKAAWNLDGNNRNT